MAAARQGSWSLYLSDCKPVPRDWFPSLHGRKVLCLASGGGQQAPIFAALGADVTLLDASPRQLAQDRFVAERDNLSIRLVEGDMADLSAFADESFGLIFNPPSTLFIPDVAPVWDEAEYRAHIVSMGYSAEVQAQVQAACAEIEALYLQRADPFNHAAQIALYRQIKAIAATSRTAPAEQRR